MMMRMRSFSFALIVAATAALGACTQVVEVEVDAGPEPWIEKASLPYASDSHACCAVDGKLYLTGGIPSRWGFLIYDPDADEWTEGPPLPTGRQHHACAAVDGKLYVFGGPYEGGSSMESDVLDVYDPVSDSWETLGELPAVRVEAAGAVLDGDIYLLGGIVGDFPSASVDVYDVSAESWGSAPDMPRAIGSAAAAALPDRIVSVGGEPEEQYLIEGGDPVLDPRNAWALDPASSGWEVIAAQSVFREGAAAVGYGGRAYVFGGMYRGSGGDSVILATAERWDVETGEWEPLTPMPSARVSSCGALIGDTIYVAGGAYLDDHDFEASDRVFAYRPAFDKGPGEETAAPEVEPPPALLWVVASDGDFTDRVALEWHDGGTGFGYTVWRSTDESGPFCELWDTEDAVTAYEDTEVEPGVTYWYRVSYWDEAMGDESELSPGDSGYAES
jgi:hypothetical protein